MNGSRNERDGDPSECCKIIHIPENPPILPHLQTTVDVLAAEISPKHANTLIKKLNVMAPLEGLHHVKRIRKNCLDGGKIQLHVILCMASGNDGESNDIPEDMLELVNMYQLSTFTTKVCKYAAATKEDWEEQCKLWPTSFHPPTYNIDGITGFTEDNSSSVFKFMKHAVCMAKSGISVVNAAVIVDPSTKQIIASGCDEVLSCNTLRNKMEKNSKLLTEWSPDEPEQFYNNVSCLNPWGWLDRQLHLSPDSWHPLRHAAIVAIENSAARDRHLFPVNGRGPDSVQNHSKMSSPTGYPLKRQKMNENIRNGDKLDCDRCGMQCNSNRPCMQCNSNRPYLCTGYDIYFVWEPCIMCAMAIVHQRIKRVFYAFPNPNAGALGSVHRLQGERSLNHHYAVFRVLLPEAILESVPLASACEIDH